MKIAVYGSASGDIPEDIRAKARNLGRLIAQRGHTLITGACPGLPYDAVQGAVEYKGRVIGFSPALDIEDQRSRFKFPVVGFSEIRYIPPDFPYSDDKQACLKLRNVYSVAESDAAIFIRGGMGSLNEYTIADSIGIPIGLLLETGGITELIPQLVREIPQRSKHQVLSDNDPLKLIEKLEFS